MKQRHVPDPIELPAPIARRSKTSALRAFERDEEGSLIIFSLMMFMLMALVAGMSLDIERFETARTKLQATADGAALAGASLTQNVSPLRDVVEDYFVKAEMDKFLEDIDIISEINMRRVTVTSDVTVPTHFFHMIGIDHLSTVVTSVAEESIGNVEIALVLDVSGSMGSNSKLANLKDAAEDFVDAMYENAEAGTISTSIVPYSTQVSAGPDILSHFPNRGDAEHEISHCVDFSDADFERVTLLPTEHVAQTLHADLRTNEGNSWWDPGEWLPVTECPSDSWTDILLYSESISALKAYVNAFRATDWTSIELGVKWGAAILDPAFQPIISAAVTANKVNDAFDGRPLSYDESDGLKVMVVMTDGINTNQYVMADPYRSGPSFVYVYYDNYDRPYYSVWGGTGEPDPTVRTETVTTTDSVCDYWYRYHRRWYCNSWEQVTTTTTQEVESWYLVNDYSNDGVSTGWRSAPYGGPYGGGENATRMNWDDLWAEVPVEIFTDRYLYNMGYSSTVRNAIEAARHQVNNSKKDERTRDICTAAKANGVLIYAIGFEAPTASQNLLRACATTASHYFNVEGTQISQAFSAIAADINRLRLTK